jgi:hypothetical protein
VSRFPDRLLSSLRLLASPSGSAELPLDAWEEVAELARRLDLEPALRESRSAPAELRERWERRYREMQAGNMLRQEAYDEVSAALAREGLPHLPLKGMDHLRTVWRDPGLRPMRDIDLLVPRGRSRDGAEALRRLGFEKVGEGPTELMLRRGVATVEVHDALLPPPSPVSWREEGVWHRSLAGERSLERILAPEDRIVYLALHGILGEIKRARIVVHLRDLRALLERGPSVRWERILGAAQSDGTGPFLGWWMHGLRELLGDDCPALPRIPFRPDGRRAAAGFRRLEDAVRRALESPGREPSRRVFLLYWLPPREVVRLLHGVALDKARRWVRPPGSRPNNDGTSQAPPETRESGRFCLTRAET